jgi:hypothetical protein
MLDGYSVCQHCFEATPGVFTVDGLTYCEDCYPLVAPEEDSAKTNLEGIDRNPSSGPASAKEKGNVPSPMTLRTSGRPVKKGVFAPPPIPAPQPSKTWTPSRRVSRRPLRKYEDVRVLHRGRQLEFVGSIIKTGVHEGLNPLWTQENERPGKYTWVGVYQRREEDFILASRIARPGGPGSGVAFRFSKEKLLSFLRRAIPNASPREKTIWQWALSEIE